MPSLDHHASAVASASPFEVQKDWRKVLDDAKKTAVEAVDTLSAISETKDLIENNQIKAEYAVAIEEALSALVHLIGQVDKVAQFSSSEANGEAAKSLDGLKQKFCKALGLGDHDNIDLMKIDSKSVSASVTAAPTVQEERSSFSPGA